VDLEGINEYFAVTERSGRYRYLPSITTFSVISFLIRILKFKIYVEDGGRPEPGDGAIHGRPGPPRSTPTVRAQGTQVGRKRVLKGLSDEN
jgi:hypothetical protein